MPESELVLRCGDHLTPLSPAEQCPDYDPQGVCVDWCPKCSSNCGCTYVK